jgi:acetolactate synthase-1/3 small subunit
LKKRIFSVTVENNSGVLSRVSGLFARRGFNIDSLSVGETENPRYSRMTIVSQGDENTLTQIKNQLAKLIEVINIEELSHDDAVVREYVLLRLSCDIETRSRVIELTNIFRANIVDVSDSSMIIELTGTPSKTAAFIKLAQPLGLTEIVRTGTTAMRRGQGEDAEWALDSDD